MSNKPLTAAAKKALTALRSTFGESKFLIDFRLQVAYSDAGSVPMATSVYSQIQSAGLIAPVPGTLHWTVAAV